MPVARLNATEVFYSEVGEGIPCLVMHGGLGFDHTYMHPWLDPLGDVMHLVYYDHRCNGRSGRPSLETLTFEFSAPMESSVSYQRDSEVVPLSELPHFRDGLSYLAPGAEIATVWDHHANLVPLLREMGLQEGITVTSRYESLTGETYETLWTINPLLIPGGLYAPQQMGATD